MPTILDRHSPVLEKLADLYIESEAGRTGMARHGFSIRYEKLLKAAKCSSGDRYANAEHDLSQGDGAILSLKRRRNLQSNPPTLVKVGLSHEPWLFVAIGRRSPTEERSAWKALFDEAAQLSVPMTHSASWLELCRRRGEQALVGKGWSPFQRKHRRRAKEQLEIVSKLLGWNRRCLIRTASAQLAGSSKFFEHCTDTLETLLHEASGGTVGSLAALGIEPNPTAVRFHGPVHLRLRNVVNSYQGLAGESALSEIDIAAADVIETDALRCVTIENATTFYELCRLDCPDLLILTSYANQATIDFLRRLPTGLPIFHFGDTDPWGYDVLLDLRRRSARRIEALHMRQRNWAEALPPGTRARRFLNARDWRKLDELLDEPLLEDVWSELLKMEATRDTGDFEQEGLLPLAATFPYIDINSDYGAGALPAITLREGRPL